MNQQALNTKQHPYPPFDNLPILHEQEHFSFQLSFSQIRSLIPEKYLPKGKSSNLSIQKCISDIKVGIEAMAKDVAPEQPTEQSQTNSHRGNQELMGRLMEALEESESKSKKIQIKLMSKMKRLDDQLKQKDIEIRELRNIVEEKEIELNSLSNINQKKYRQIRSFQEDIFDLEEELQTAQQNLECEKEMSQMLEKKIQQLQTKLNGKKTQKEEAEVQTEGVAKEEKTEATEEIKEMAKQLQYYLHPLN